MHGVDAHPLAVGVAAAGRTSWKRPLLGVEPTQLPADAAPIHRVAGAGGESDLAVAEDGLQVADQPARGPVVDAVPGEELVPLVGAELAARPPGAAARGGRGRGRRSGRLNGEVIAASCGGTKPSSSSTASSRRSSAMCTGLGAGELLGGEDGDVLPGQQHAPITSVPMESTMSSASVQSCSR